ncbi:MAG: hypothetical protein GF311_17750 [Candidatus Lokiarchaeota archaeon]|nr:hypothetical protein [Candidatus Lokiarchaeota archaeon]
MTNSKKNTSRNLPISLQGIAIVLRYLRDRGDKLASIRNISKNTDLSMRVTKNILLQLEKFNQVERVVEKNNILPKWKITRFGKKVIKKANGNREIQSNLITKEQELLNEIAIPNEIDELKRSIKGKNDSIEEKFKSLQLEMSKILGTVINLDDPIFEDLISFILKRVKYLRHIFVNAPEDPIKKLKLKKAGEPKRKITEKEAKITFSEILFLNFIILNDINGYISLSEKISLYLENEANVHALSFTKDAREELRLLTDLVMKRVKINPDLHLFNDDDLKKIMDNKLETELINKIINKQDSQDIKRDSIKEAILESLNALNNSSSDFNNHIYKIKDTIPLYEFYQFLLDQNPNLIFTIEELETVINRMTDDGLIPGIREVRTDQNRYFKLLQLKAHDISEDENKLISVALILQKFTLADIINALDWKKEKCTNILKNLETIGIIKHSKSFLHGDKWYIISEGNY